MDVHEQQVEQEVQNLEWNHRLVAEHEDVADLDQKGAQSDLLEDS